MMAAAPNRLNAEMAGRDPRKDGTPEERLAFWLERLANAERLGRPGHIDIVRSRVETLKVVVDARGGNDGLA